MNLTKPFVCIMSKTTLRLCSLYTTKPPTIERTLWNMNYCDLVDVYNMYIRIYVPLYALE